MNDWKRTTTIAAASLLTLLSGATAVALSCSDTNSERITYEIAQVRVNGEVTETTQYGERVTANGDFDGGVRVHVETDDWSSTLRFDNGGAE